MRTVLMVLGALVMIFFVIPLVGGLAIGLFVPFIRIIVVVGALWVIWKLFFRGNKPLPNPR